MKEFPVQRADLVREYTYRELDRCRLPKWYYCWGWEHAGL